MFEGLRTHAKRSRDARQPCESERRKAGRVFPSSFNARRSPGERLCDTVMVNVARQRADVEPDMSAAAR